jgi:Outer membrane protein beta-barrel domain
MLSVRFRTIDTVAAILSLSVAAIASAQGAGPYVSGHVGVSGGEGGGQLTGGGAVGYMTPRRLGFELEVSATPDLDLEDLGVRNLPPPGIVPIPAPTLNVTGRLLTFQTNTVAALPSGGKLRAFVVGGGGVANLQEDLTYRYRDLLFSTLDPNNPVLIVPTLQYNLVERRISRSENALCLNVGGIVEYAFKPRFTLGVDARYQHAFFNSDSLQTARVAARIRWGF